MNVGLNYSYFAVGNKGKGLSFCRVADTVLPYKEDTLTVSAAKAFGNFRIGAALSIHRMDSVEKGRGFSLTPGVLHTRPFNRGMVVTGVTIHNLISKLNYTTGSTEDLKRIFAVGVAYQVPRKAVASLEIRGKELNIGYQYLFTENLEGRVGLNDGKFTGGFSVRVGN